MFPHYPSFKKIELTDCDFIERFTKEFPPYNDFEFMSLWTYNTDWNNMFSIYNDNLILKIQDFLSSEYFYTFIGTSEILTTAEMLIERSKNEGLGNKLYLIPEISINSDPKIIDFLSVTEDPDSFDYILSAAELSALEGSKYHDNRYSANKFAKEHPDNRIELLDLSLEPTQNKILDLFALWEMQRGKKRDETQIELTAIERLFDIVKILNVKGLGIFIEDKLIAFSIFHKVNEEYAILSFEKSNMSFSGAYSYLNQQTAKEVEKWGCKYINYEQDLGIPGLKKAKQDWNPVFFLKKYTISEK